MTELPLRLSLCLVGALLAAAGASGEGIEIQNIKLPQITGPARLLCGALGLLLVAVGAIGLPESPTSSPPMLKTNDGDANATQPPLEVSRPPVTVPVTRSEPPPPPIAKSEPPPPPPSPPARPKTTTSPEEFVRAYYDDLKRGDSPSALSKWQSPSSKTKRLIENTGSIQLDGLKRLDGDADSSSAHVWVDTSGKTIDGVPGRWKVTLNLINVGGEWRISSMSR